MSDAGPSVGSVTTPTEGEQQGFARRALGSVLGSLGPLLGLFVLCAFLAVSTDTFLTTRNFLNILDQVTVLGVMAVGMTFVILIGGIDLSVGSVLALAMMVMGYTSAELGVPLPLAMLLGVVAGGACGLVSGLLITRFDVPPFIATLAMLSVARGLANMITDGQQIVGFPEWFNDLAQEKFGGFLTVTVALMVAIVGVAWAYQQFRTGGRSLYAIGGNKEVARLAGINVKRVTVWVYITCAALAGVAGIVLAARLDSVQPSSGFTYELDTIAAVVIGGTSLTGGQGGIGGTVVGVLIIGVLRNGLNLLGVSPFTQQVVIGVVIALAVAADVFRRRRSGS
jgi:ribose transport system permease protein